MALIAVVALGLGVMFELHNHAELDRLLKRQADGYREAAIHHRRALECKLAAETQQPYQRAERAKLSASDRVRTFTPPGGFRSWEGELDDHLHWGYRSYDEVVGLGPKLKAIEARLLLPVPTGR